MLSVPDRKFKITVSKGICILLILAIGITGCNAPKSVAVPVPEPEYWPTQEWRSSTPEAQGMDSKLLAQMLEEVSSNQTNIHSVLVIRNGYMVAEAYFHPYTRDTKIDIQSITKSVIGALVGIAIRDGNIQSVNDKLLSFFPKRTIENPSSSKNSIRLKHLLSMTSGFPCQEFSSSGQSMEQSSGWVQYMLDLPVDTRPGRTFGYCDGNPHLLSAIVQITTGRDTREFANQELFKPLGIPAVEETDWGTDPQGIPNGGYGLNLRPVDLAKIALLYLQNGKWDGQQLLPAGWVADSTKQYIQKPEGPGYGYLWTVYPDKGRYSALGVKGQQIHVYPSRNLIVIVTSELETFMEAPEVERMLDKYILPAIQSDTPLANDPGGVTRLQKAVDFAANPVQPVPPLPEIAQNISGKVYTFEENNVAGLKTVSLVFEPGSDIAKLTINEADPILIGLDNLYRTSTAEPVCYDCPFRGHWIDEQTFLLELLSYAYGTTLYELQFKADNLEIKIYDRVFRGEPLSIKGSK